MHTTNHSSLGPLVGRGATAEIRAWGSDQVIKLYHDDWPERKIAYEAEIGRRVHAIGVAAPAVGDYVQWNSKRGLIYERIDGSSLGAAFQKEPWRVAEFAHLFAQTHAALHRHDASAFPALRARLADRIRSADLLAATKTNLIDRIDRLPDGDALCHGDFHFENVLLSSRGPVVIDWENVAHGDPLADVARTSLLIRHAYLHTPPGGQRWLIRAGCALFHGLYLRWYAVLTGRSVDQIGAWRAPLAAARLSENATVEARHLRQIAMTA